ncbi:MAG: hypothetical protein KBD31_05610 [Proteobacteria bacterium]|nr:hypothetical protein [Pseudomonadota bacterium]
MFSKLFLLFFIVFINGVSGQESAKGEGGSLKKEDDKTKTEQSLSDPNNPDVIRNEKMQAYEETQKLKIDEDNYFFKESVFKLAPFNIPIFKNGSVVSTVQMEVAMQISDEKEWPNIRTFVPILYNHMFTDLYHSLNFLWDRVSSPSPEILKKRMMRIANKTLGDGKIKTVLIGLVAVTPR